MKVLVKRRFAHYDDTIYSEFFNKRPTDAFLKAFLEYVIHFSGLPSIASTNPEQFRLLIDDSNYRGDDRIPLFNRDSAIPNIRDVWTFRFFIRQKTDYDGLTQSGGDDI